MNEDYGKTYGIDKLAELLIERGIEFCVKDGTSLFFVDGSGNPHECWMAGAEENLVNALIVVTPEQLLSVPDLNGIIAENEKLRHENDKLRTENERLRKLLNNSLDCIDYGNCESCYCYFGGCTLRSAMRELGIEVG